MHVPIQEQEKMPVHFKKQVQIKAHSRVKVGILLFDKAFIKVLTKYFDYSDIFLVENTIKLLENTRTNKYTIKLKENK